MKRLISILAVILLTVAAVLSALPISAVGVREYDTPEGYNEHDYQKLLAFYETADENGVKNGSKLSPDYDPADPATWGGEPSFEDYVGLTWTDEPEKRLSSFGCEAGVFSVMYGALDLSGCTALTALWCGYNRIEVLNLSGCTALKTLSCSENPLNDSLDLTGCTALSELSCSNCGLTELDLGALPGLTKLEMSCNYLESLDLTLCPSLEEVYLTYMLMKELKVSGHPSLKTLVAEGLDLTELDLSDCAALATLSCEGNGLTKLELSGCTGLRSLFCGYTGLTSLDVTQLPHLAYLDCYGDGLTELDLSNNPELVYLNIFSNNITGIDLSGCPLLENLNCDLNPLTSLDLSGCPLIPFDHIDSVGNGYIGLVKYDEGEGGYYAFAHQLQPLGFVGWYDEDGALITMTDHLCAEEYPYADVTAVFLSDGIAGDSNGDGTVDASDALNVMRCAMGITELASEAEQLCDVDGSGSIEASDALLILRFVMGIADTL
ncbi:MAG: hypothetical protein II155_00220 [Clostridia bacterium]|nr:hypothetical protein [Clostridia bacterium]